MRDYFRNFLAFFGIFLLVAGVVAPLVVGAMTNNAWWLLAYLITGPAFLALVMDV